METTSSSNLDRYKKDVDLLIARGLLLHDAMLLYATHKEFQEDLDKMSPAEAKKTKDQVAKLPNFKKEYQPWYSEAKALIKQLLPERLTDFTSYYEKPPRKSISYDTYRIADALEGAASTNSYTGEQIVGPKSGVPKFYQQLMILTSIKSRFDSSLFDIRRLVTADIFESELESAKELAQHKFNRAAGAVSGVVLEKHLAQVCENHKLKMKKNPAIGDLNNTLKEAEIVDLPTWRFIQHLADIRNICDHNKNIEPSKEQVDDLILGVSKVIKTLF